MSLRDKVLSKPRKEEIIEIDGDKHLIRGLSELEGSYAESLATSSEGRIDGGRLRREILVRSWFDPDTKERLFSDSEASTLETIPREITGRVYQLAMKLSGYSSDDEGKKKNSQATES